MSSSCFRFKTRKLVVSIWNQYKAGGPILARTLIFRFFIFFNFSSAFNKVNDYNSERRISPGNGTNCRNSADIGILQHFCLKHTHLKQVHRLVADIILKVQMAQKLIARYFYAQANYCFVQLESNLLSLTVIIMEHVSDQFFSNVESL